MEIHRDIRRIDINSYARFQEERRRKLGKSNCRVAVASKMENFDNFDETL